MGSASFGDWIVNSGSLVAWISLVVSVATFFITRAEKNKELRQGQAIKVSAWLTDVDLDSAHVVVANYSDLPIYGVAVAIDKGPWRYSEEFGEGLSSGVSRDSEAICKVIPPGKYQVTLPGGDFCGCSFYPTVTMGFVCANGTSWVRAGNGRLRRINQDPFDYFDISIPSPFSEVKLVD